MIAPAAAAARTALLASAANGAVAAPFEVPVPAEETFAG